MVFSIFSYFKNRFVTSTFKIKNSNYYQVFLWNIKCISDKENNGLLLSYCFMLMLSSRDVLSQVIRSIRLFFERYKEISQDQSHRVASHLYGSCIPHGKKIESLFKFYIFQIYNIQNSIIRISFLSQVSHIALLLYEKLVILIIMILI